MQFFSIQENQISMMNKYSDGFLVYYTPGQTLHYYDKYKGILDSRQYVDSPKLPSS